MTPLSTPVSLPDHNSLILSNTKHGNFSQAFSLFNEPSNPGHRPNEFALAGLLKASSLLSDPALGQQLHARSIRSGLAADHGVRTSLIAMYSASGHLTSSRKVFDEIPSSHNHDVPLWNSILSAHVAHGQYNESFGLLSTMINVEQLAPSAATYIIVLGACADWEEIETGRTLHARMIKEGIIHEVKMMNSLVTFYAKCGASRDARRVFDSADGMNVVSWNAMIAGYEQNGECGQALSLFGRLSRKQGVKPNRITVLSVLSAVSSMLDLRLGRQVHGHVIRSGFESDTSIGNSLITMYGKCRDVVKGRMVFDRMPLKDVISWNSMLAAYSQNEQSENCYRLFEEMRWSGLEPDDRTLIAILGATSSGLPSCKPGREIHGYMLRRSERKGMQVSVCNAVITMYAKNSRLRDAEKMFEGMMERDSHSWNALMDGYSINGSYDDAVEHFICLLDEGLPFDHLSLSILLTACGRLASVELGKQIHGFSLKHHHPKTSLLSVSNALVSMYSKCGSIGDAARTFQRMECRDVVSWTAMITGCAHHGMACESLGLFEKMTNDGIKPNTITYLGLLTACAHAGLIDEGSRCFSMMSDDKNAEPSIEHYACMVDLFGRAGQFARAEAMIETGISHLKLKRGSSLPLWKVLLGACHAHRQLEMGKRAAARVLEQEPEDETTHVLLANMYASFGLWREAIDVRAKMRDRELKKEAGCSWVELANKKHVFVAGDVSHPNQEEIYEKLGELDGRCRGMGYVPMTELVLHDVDEVQKERILGRHSERLALSFAVLKTGNARPIRVIKNLRVCGDCHNWMKFASQVEGREIILRDSRRFHSFKDGKCSCGDYW